MLGLVGKTDRDRWRWK